MKKKTRRILTYGISALVLIVASPFLLFIGWLAFTTVQDSFPSDNSARILFDRVTRHQMPETVTDLYFRKGSASPTDEGSSVVTFRARQDAINELVNTKTRWPTQVGTNWSVMDKAYQCRCSGCYRYDPVVTVPENALFKLSGKIHTFAESEHTLLAIDKASSTVFMCRFDP